MSDEAEYLFKIDVYTPSTLPMRRLAEYMLEVARLLGEYDHVHFERVRKGSAVLASRVDFVAVPKVRARVRAGASGEVTDLRRTWLKLDQMLASDNATGVLSEKGHKGLIFRFPGREAASAEIGPISQEGSIQGILVSIGGEDNTAHARLKDGDEVRSCEISRDIARRLCPHLYGPTIRMLGRGRWRRTKEGAWELLHFKGHDFEILDDRGGFRAVVDKVRTINGGGAFEGDDPVAEVIRLRRAE